MQISSTEIGRILTRLEETPHRLAAMTRSLEETRLHRKLGEGEWCVNEILAHLCVCAEVWGKSILTMIAQDQPTLRYVSPRTVAKKRNYATQAYYDSFQEFSMHRSDLLQALKTLSGEAWSRGATFTGTTKGREQTIFTYAQRIVDHEQEHLEQIAKALKEGEFLEPPPPLPNHLVNQP
jgi:uncharacterized damage-inducible protein DinB